VDITAFGSAPGLLRVGPICTNARGTPRLAERDTSRQHLDSDCKLVNAPVAMALKLCPVMEVRRLRQAVVASLRRPLVTDPPGQRACPRSIVGTGDPGGFP
jgi:hypothetical protein